MSLRKQYLFMSLKKKNAQLLISEKHLGSKLGRVTQTTPWPNG